MREERDISVLEKRRKEGTNKGRRRGGEERNEVLHGRLTSRRWRCTVDEDREVGGGGGQAAPFPRWEVHIWVPWGGARLSYVPQTGGQSGPAGLQINPQDLYLDQIFFSKAMYLTHLGTAAL